MKNNKGVKKEVIKQMQKHKKMFAVLLVFAMVFSLFSMVAPPTAEAQGQINMLKDTWQHEDGPEHPDNVYLIGQEVHYQLKIENEHATNSMEIEITDIDPSGNVWYWNGTEFVETDPNYTETIAPLDIWEHDFHYIVEEDAVYLHRDGYYAIQNTLKAYGIQGPEDIDASVTKTSQVIQPEIEVTKTVSHETSKAGDEVTYTICIENAGDWALEDITVEDSIFGDISAYFPDTLEPGEENKVCVDFDYTIQEGDDDPLLNEVDVWGTADGFDPAIAGAVVSDDAYVEVDLVHPALSITKEANREVAKLGSTIEYTVEVCNDGDVDMEVVVEDTLGGTLFDGIIEAGECEEFEYDYTVTQADVDEGTLVNTATATGYLAWLGLDNVIGPVEAEFEVQLVTPEIEITKTADPTEGYVGDEIEYTIVVENVGDYALENIVVNDTMFGDITAEFGFSEPLLPGESETAILSYTILEGDLPGPIENTASVYSNPVGLPNDIEDEDDATVTILVEELTVEKDAITSYTRTHEWDIDKWVETEFGDTIGEGEEEYPKIWLYSDESGD